MDWFAREYIKWYENYFGNKNIKFNIVEVKKNGSIKFGEVKGSKLFTGEVIKTGDADKICKFIEFVPQGKVDNRLFFL